MEIIRKTTRILLLVLITVMITTVVVTSYMTRKYNLSDGSGLIDYNLVAPNGEFKKLAAIYSKLKETYYQDIDPALAEEGAINGLLYSLGDPYSYYMNEDEYDDFTSETMGNFFGIGVYLNNNVELNKIEVISAVKDSPAAAADIRTGDYVLSVNGVEYSGSEMQEAVKNIKGEEGTEVVLIIQRGEEKITKTLKRKQINVYQLESEILEGNIGYINIKLFDSDVSKDFAKIYKEMEKKKVNGVIIDVRNNPGGVLQEVVDIADLLLPEGIIVYTIDKSGERTDFISNAESTNLPMVVLINEGSASASEILAGALSNHGKATLVGKKTYGKGLVQTLLSMGDKTAIKVTTSEYFTPNGDKINKIGIQPDVEVDLPKDLENQLHIDKAKDTQLKKAIEIMKKK